MKLQDNNGRGCLASSMIAFLSFPAINQLRFQSMYVYQYAIFLKGLGDTKSGKAGGEKLSTCVSLHFLPNLLFLHEAYQILNIRIPRCSEAGIRENGQKRRNQ